MSLSKKEFKALILFFLILCLGACNTFSGMGKDISTSADWAKAKMNSPDNSTNQQSTTNQSKSDSNQQSTQQKAQPTK
jgi:predicted small secreted protein